MNYLSARALEASTIRGVIMFLSGIIGFTLSPELTDNIVAFGVAASGLLGVLLPDKLIK